MATLADNSDYAGRCASSCSRASAIRHYRTMEPDAHSAGYGDSMNIPAIDPRQWYAITPCQYDMLQAVGRR